MFTENQLLVEFSPIMKVSLQRTNERGDFYRHYFIRVLAYVVISKYFILKLTIWILSSWKTITSPPLFLLVFVLSHFLISCVHLKILFRIYLKEIFLVSCRSWKVLYFRFERCFKNYLFIYIFIYLFIYSFI